MTPPTAQEIFDTVATHLFTQGRQARLSNTTCAYRSDDGLKCAIGALIPDDMYRSEMEGGSPSILITYFPALRTVFGDSMRLLALLQRAHDNALIWQSTFTMRMALQRDGSDNIWGNVPVDTSILDTLSFADGR